MTVYIKVKSLSKHKPVIDGIPFKITGEVTSVNSLIELIVLQNVREYNNQLTETRILPYLIGDEVSNGELIGKISFNERKNENNQDADEAVKNALQCFNDGIFRMFVNDVEYTAGDELTIRDGDGVVFVRLTMLAGRLW